MDRPDAVDLQVLSPNTSANSTTTTIQPDTSPLLERIISESVERPHETTQNGVSFLAFNSETSESISRAEDATSPLPETDSGNLEDYLQQRAYSDRQSRELLYHYKTFKDRPGTELFHHVFYLNQIDWFEGHDNRHLDSGTFAEVLDALGRALVQPSPIPLRLCILINTIPTSVRFVPHYSFVSRIFAIAQPTSPVLAILYTIMRKWCVSIESINSWAVERTSTKTTLASLPSAKGITSILESTIWKYTHLYWVQDVAPYLSDMSVYIWRPHLEPVVIIGATICISPLNAQGRDLFIYFRPSKGTPFGVRDLHRILRSHIPAALQTCSSPNMIVLSVILAVYSILIKDTANFIDSVRRQIEKVWGEGKRNPSVDKMNYTLYLGECSTSCSLALAKASLILGSLSDSEPLPQEDNDVQEKFYDWRSTTRGDLQYLTDQLTELDTRIQELRTMIREQLDLRQFRLSTPLAVLAAMYLPFSFVSTFFGMNIRDPLWNSPTPADEISNFRSPMDGTGPLEFTQNQTNSTVGAVSTSGSHLFTLKEFLYVGFILTAITLGVPFLGVKIFWTIVRWLKQHTRIWRFVGIILGLGYVVCNFVFFPQLIFLTVIIPQQIFGAFRLVFERDLSGKIKQKKKWAKSRIAFFALTAMPGFNHFDEYLDTNPRIYNLWAIAPVIYLFIRGIAPSRRFLFRFHLLSQDTILRIPEVKKRYHKLGIGFFATICVLLSILNLFMPAGSKYFTTTLFGTYTLLYGVDKFRERSILGQVLSLQWEWFGFLAVVAGSIASDALVHGSVLIPTAPFLYRIVYCLAVNDQGFITTYLPNWMNFRRVPADRPVDSELGHQA